MCLFCKIINKEIQADIIAENESAVGFLDIHPIAPGHSMIIPKVHAENILDLPNEEVEKVFLLVKELTDMIQKSLNPDGFTIGINHGKVSGQEIEHLHIHIIPRWITDEGKSIHSVVKNTPQEDLETIKNKIINKK